MAKLSVLNLNNEKVKDINLNKEIFDIEVNEKVMRDAIILAQASLRQGTHKTKTRSEVSGGGRKPWKQKGTGNARQGSIRAVQWVGGGIAFGPQPRDYSIKQNKKERRLAIKSAYTSKVKASEFVCVETLAFDTPKTKVAKEMLEKLEINNKKVLMIVKEYSENTILAVRNLRNVLLMQASEVSVLDLVNSDVVLVEEEALKTIEEVLK